MNRRTLLLASLAALAPIAASAQPRAAVLSDADRATVAQVQAYLNGVRSLKARFLQIAGNGQTATGTAWLERPGRMRFEYDPPSPLLLVAGHGLVTFHDAKLGQTSNIPVGQTPLGLLLADTITLTGPVTITDFARPPGQIAMTLVRTASPGDGTLTLLLNASPLALTGWSVVDAQGRETRIRLSDVQLGGDFPARLFRYVDPSLLGAPPP